MERQQEDAGIGQRPGHRLGRYQGCDSASRTGLHAAGDVPLGEEALVVLAGFIDGRVAGAAPHDTLIVTIEITATKSDTSDTSN